MAAEKQFYFSYVRVLALFWEVNVYEKIIFIYKEASRHTVSPTTVFLISPSESITIGFRGGGVSVVIFFQIEGVGGA